LPSGGSRKIFRRIDSHITDWIEHGVGLCHLRISHKARPDGRPYMQISSWIFFVLFVLNFSGMPKPKGRVSNPPLGQIHFLFVNFARLNSFAFAQDILCG